MGKLTRIEEWKNRDTILVLKELLEMAESGEVTGLAFSCKIGEVQHGIGLTGDYASDPAQIFAIVSRAQHIVNGRLDRHIATGPAQILPIIGALAASPEIREVPTNG